MDVFSAGVTLAYAARLKSVWAGDTQDAITESIKNDEPNLEGLTPLQQEFIRPLLEKLPIDRPNSESVHIKALEYIEYLIDRENRSKPVALRVKKSLARRLNRLIHSKMAISGMALALIATAAFAATVQNENGNQSLKIVSPTISPTASAAPSNSESAAAVPISSDQQMGSTECQRLTNELKTSEAITVCLEAAKSGDAVAMNALGYNYDVGMKNEALGIEWYKKAAKAGSAVAMYNLGTLYIQKNNTIEAEKWFKQCVDSDYAFCAFNYGSLLEKSKRISEAKVIYQKGVKLGDSGSAQNLGLIYVNEQNWAKAKEAFTVGAKLNYHLSMYSLAMVLIKNYSDLDSGCTWLRQAVKVKSDYDTARKAVIEICKNRNFEVAPDVEILTGPLAPYQVTQTASDRKAGDWVIWLKTDQVDASSATGIQYRVSGSKDKWQYVFYGYYTNASGIYSYINERPGLEGACLDFRLVKESKDGYIVKIWEMPASICKTN